jgi:hypothetical protein
MHYAHMPNAKAAHPHNLPLQLAAEWGLPFATLCAAGVGVALVGFMRRLSRLRPDAEALRTGTPLFLGCVAVLADGMVSGNFVMPVSQIWIAVLVGFSVAWCRAQGGERLSPAGRPWHRRALLVALLMSQVWLLANTWPEASRLTEHLRRTMDSFTTERLQPRFWSVGRF